MSERLNQNFGEKMAIPEGGGEDFMDVTYPEESHDSGYVSIKSKGPGRPIHIRLPGKPETLSHGIEANCARSVQSDVFSQKPAIKPDPEGRCRDQSEEFLDKNTGHAVPLESGSHDNVSSERSDDREAEQAVQTFHTKINSQLAESEQKDVPSYSAFKSQAEVVSLSSNFRYIPEHVYDSPGKTKYKLHQAGAKKKIGSKKKTGQGKDNRRLPLVAREQPYPKWMNIPLSAIFNGQTCVDIDGRKHLVEVSLVPVDEVPDDLQNITMQDDRRGPGVDHADGSIDRPPDVSFRRENNNGKTPSVLPASDTHLLSNTDNLAGNIFHGPPYTGTVGGIVSAPNNYGNTNDQPLDLTVVKPLDLSAKGKPINDTTDDTWQEQRYIGGELNEVPYGMSSTSTTVRGEFGVGCYRTRCPSSLSVDDRDSIVGDESLDSGLASGLSQHYSEERSNDDGNLPSLGKLTLECKHQQQASALPKSGIQDTAVKQEMDRTTNGQQNILNLLNSGQVTIHQLMELYWQNQQKKAQITHQYTPSIAASTGVTGQLQHLLQTKPADQQIEESVTEHEIPTPAMPNLQSLELADNQGVICESENERMRSRLKAKIRLRQELEED